MEPDGLEGMPGCLPLLFLIPGTGERAGNCALNAGAWRTVASEPFVLVIRRSPLDDSAESGPVEVDLRQRDLQMRIWRDVEGLSARQVAVV